MILDDRPAPAELRCYTTLRDTTLSITTDRLRSYSSALDEVGLHYLHRPGRLRENNRAEFKSQPSAQRFLTTHAGIYNEFYTQPHFIRRRSCGRCGATRLPRGIAPLPVESHPSRRRLGAFS
jgi:hypothetical protein